MTPLVTVTDTTIVSARGTFLLAHVAGVRSTHEEGVLWAKIVGGVLLILGLVHSAQGAFMGSGAIVLLVALVVLLFGLKGNGRWVVSVMVGGAQQVVAETTRAKEASAAQAAILDALNRSSRTHAAP